MRTWVKICGITRIEDALACEAAGVDAIGLNFCESSPRRCELDAAAAITAALPAAVAVYGVFVAAGRERIARVIERTGISGLQFHGGEDEQELRGWGLPVIRAIAASSREDLVAALAGDSQYQLLIDSPRGGGSGERFSDDVVAGLNLSRCVVAGGLTPGNVAAVVRALRPAGVDTAGGVEIAAGIKDPARIREFVNNARSS